MANTFEINQAVNLADIGTKLNEAIFAFDEEGADSARDIIFDLHTMIYPNSSRLATDKELADMAAAEPDATQHDCPQCEFYRIGLNGIVRDATAEKMNRKRAAAAVQETACQTGDCDPACTRCDDGTTAEMMKRARLEIKLLNLKSYIRLLENTLEVTAPYGDSNYRIMDVTSFDAAMMTIDFMRDIVEGMLPK